MTDERKPTEQEVEFFALLSRRFPELQDWYHQDVNGTPWMLVSHDFIDSGGVSATLRLDYDGTTLEGGWSPAALNWDAEMRAASVPIDTAEPDGLLTRTDTAADAAQIAAAWIEQHLARQTKID